MIEGLQKDGEGLLKNDEEYLDILWYNVLGIKKIFIYEFITSKETRWNILGSSLVGIRELSAFELEYVFNINSNDAIRKYKEFGYSFEDKCFFKESDVENAMKWIRSLVFLNKI